LIFSENRECLIDTNLLTNSTIEKEIKISKINTFGEKVLFDAYIPVFGKKRGNFIGTMLLQIDFYKFYSFEKGHFSIQRCEHLFYCN